MSTRFKNALHTDPNAIVHTDFQYGMARMIPGDDLHFEFSNLARGDNWELRKYEDVISYQSLDPVRSHIDNNYYLYFKFVFR